VKHLDFAVRGVDCISSSHLALVGSGHDQLKDYREDSYTHV